MLFKLLDKLTVDMSVCVDGINFPCDVGAVVDISKSRNDYGAGWQVQASMGDPKLFHTPGEETCELPAGGSNEFIRTQRPEIFSKAMEACKKEGVTDEMDLADCSIDVVMTNNLASASAW